MSDEGYQYNDNRPISSYISPQNQSLSLKNELNSPDNISYVNQPFNSNSPENFLKGRNSKFDILLFFLNSF
jgi:hypothetical protein